MRIRYKDTVSHEVREPAESTRHGIPQIDATTARSGKSTSWRTACETLVPCKKRKTWTDNCEDDSNTKNAQTQRGKKNYQAAHVSANKARNKGYNSVLDRFLNCPNLQSITFPDRLGRRTLRTLRCNCSRRSLLHRYSGRAQKTSKELRTGTRQLREKRSDEPTRRLRRSHQSQRATIRRIQRR